MWGVLAVSIGVITIASYLVKYYFISSFEMRTRITLDVSWDVKPKQKDASTNTQKLPQIQDEINKPPMLDAPPDHHQKDKMPEVVKDDSLQLQRQVLNVDDIPDVNSPYAPVQQKGVKRSLRKSAMDVLNEYVLPKPSLELDLNDDEDSLSETRFIESSDDEEDSLPQLDLDQDLDLGKKDTRKDDQMNSNEDISFIPSEKERPIPFSKVIYSMKPSKSRKSLDTILKFDVVVEKISQNLENIKIKDSLSQDKSVAEDLNSFIISSESFIKDQISQEELKLKRQKEEEERKRKEEEERKRKEEEEERKRKEEEKERKRKEEEERKLKEEEERKKLETEQKQKEMELKQEQDKLKVLEQQSKQFIAVSKSGNQYFSKLKESLDSALIDEAKEKDVYHFNIVISQVNPNQHDNVLPEIKKLIYKIIKAIPSFQPIISDLKGKGALYEKLSYNHIHETIRRIRSDDALCEKVSAHFANTLVKRVEDEGRASVLKKFARLAVHLACSLSPVMKYIIYFLLDRCPYLVPGIPRVKRMNEKDNAKNMRSFVEFYTYIMLSEENTKNIVWFFQLKTGDHPHPIDNLWRYIARFLNIGIYDETCKLMISILDIARYKLERKYGVHWEKVKKAVLNIHLNDPKVVLEEKALLGRLKTAFDKSYIEKK